MDADGAGVADTRVWVETLQPGFGGSSHPGTVAPRGRTDRQGRFEIQWPLRLIRESVEFDLEGRASTSLINQLQGSGREIPPFAYSMQLSSLAAPSGSAELAVRSRIDQKVLGRFAVFSEALERRTLPVFDWTDTFELAPVEIGFQEGGTPTQVTLEFDASGQRNTIALGSDSDLPTDVLLPKPSTPLPFSARARGWRVIEGVRDGAPQRLEFARAPLMRLQLPSGLAVPEHRAPLHLPISGRNAHGGLAESDRLLELPFDAAQWNEWLERLAAK